MNTLTCKNCGMTIEAGSEQLHAKRCSARSKAEVYCGYCGNEIYKIVIAYGAREPEIRARVYDRPICRECEDKAADFLHHATKGAMTEEAKSKYIGAILLGGIPRQAFYTKEETEHLVMSVISWVGTQIEQKIDDTAFRDEDYREEFKDLAEHITSWFDKRE